MKGLRLITLLFMLSLIFVCFISAPVYSGDENPWDADNLKEGDLGDATDTISGFDAGRPVMRSSAYDGDYDDFDWFESLAFSLSYQVSIWFKGNNSLSSPTVGM